MNFAHIEHYSIALNRIAQVLYEKLGESNLLWVDGFCGAPEGGKALATALTSEGVKILNNYLYIFPEKKVTAVATESSREKSSLVFSRHEPQSGGRYVIVEDVCNNFSTTASLIELIEEYDAECIGNGCAWQFILIFALFGSVFKSSPVFWESFFYDFLSISIF